MCDVHKQLLSINEIIGKPHVLRNVQPSCGLSINVATMYLLHRLTEDTYHIAANSLIMSVKNLIID